MRIQLISSTLRAGMCFLVCTCALPQTNRAVVGSAFVAPTPISLAPGQLTTIFVQGIGTGLTQPVVATTLPLPTTLAGISVSLRQAVSPQGPFDVPLLAVFPIKTCRDPQADPCGTLTGVNLQVPWELIETRTGPPLVVTNSAQLTVSEGGQARAVVDVTPEVSRIHVLRRGDTITAPGTAETDLSALEPVVTHADWLPVSSANPAEPGETLVLWAVGVGRPTSGVRTGEVSGVPAPSVLVDVDFDYRPDAAPSRPFPGSPPVRAPSLSASKAVEAWLSPGSVGIYQVNFVVPNPPGLIGACGAVGRSNLTVNIGRGQSFDGAAICVRPPGRPY